MRLRASVLEAACWCIGVTLLLTYGLTRADAELGRSRDVARIEQLREPDYRSWSASRVRAYQASLTEGTGTLLGVVAIPSLKLEVPLYDDTSELHLNRGAGLIEGMSRPGSPGNVGIAGHRDGFFRVLRDIKQGETIEVRTPTKLFRYRVSQVIVVPATDARLLASTARPMVTLVTCYPFYFVGNAPQRFVVRAALISTQE
jgi:sortase A